MKRKKYMVIQVLVLHPNAKIRCEQGNLSPAQEKAWGENELLLSGLLFMLDTPNFLHSVKLHIRYLQ